MRPGSTRWFPRSPDDPRDRGWLGDYRTASGETWRLVVEPDGPWWTVRVVGAIPLARPAMTRRGG